MSHDTALELISELFKLALLLSAPLLLVILLVGLGVSLLQVVTQVQDPSIAFVPKLIMFVIALVLLAPWMLSRLTSYATSLLARLAQIS
ncbi:MAG: flagellar type III secretion system protein FliQ [Burkholderiales bacterium]|jgi:flagellar biosynthesis protein FliQ|nr:flagellar type III secretion system protein FliQ [Burkholderiales bacterium]